MITSGWQCILKRDQGEVTYQVSILLRSNQGSCLLTNAGNNYNNKLQLILCWLQSITICMQLFSSSPYLFSSSKKKGSYLNIFLYSASSFLAPYLHKFTAVVQIMHFFSAIWELMLELHFLVVLFGTNIVTNISFKASKKH